MAVATIARPSPRAGAPTIIERFSLLAAAPRSSVSPNAKRWGVSPGPPWRPAPLARNQFAALAMVGTSLGNARQITNQPAPAVLEHLGPGDIASVRAGTFAGGSPGRRSRPPRPRGPARECGDQRLTADKSGRSAFLANGSAGREDNRLQLAGRTTIRPFIFQFPAIQRGGAWQPIAGPPCFLSACRFR